MEAYKTSQDTEKIKKWLGAGSINLFGMPFSGKDTQCERLAEMLGTEVISSGDVLRSSKSEEVKIIDKGMLAPTDAFLRIVMPYLSQDRFNGKPLMLSSVGRWHGEEASVMKAAEDAGHPIKAVVMLDIDEPEVRRRYETSKQLGDRGNRADDSGSIIDNRLNEFAHKTRPVLEYYRDHGLLLEVNGQQSRDAVFEEIIGKLAEQADRDL